MALSILETGVECIFYSKQPALKRSQSQALLHGYLTFFYLLGYGGRLTFLINFYAEIIQASPALNLGLSIFLFKNITSISSAINNAEGLFINKI